MVRVALLGAALLLACGAVSSVNADCGDWSFTCSNGDCFDVGARCDGQVDCSDGSDEADGTCKANAAALSLNDKADVTVSFSEDYVGVWVLLCSDSACSRLYLDGADSTGELSYAAGVNCNAKGFDCTTEASATPVDFDEFQSGEIGLVVERGPGRLSAWLRDHPDKPRTVSIDDSYTQLSLRPDLWLSDMPVQIVVTPASTEAPSTTEQPATTVTEAPTTVAPSTTVTEAPTTEEPSTTATEATSTEQPSTIVTDAPTTEQPATTVTEPPSTVEPSTTVTEAQTSVEPASTAGTEAPSPVEPSTAVTEAPSPVEPSTTVTEAPTPVEPSTIVTDTPTPVEPSTTVTEATTAVEPASTPVEPSTSVTESATTVEPTTASSSSDGTTVTSTSTAAPWPPVPAPSACTPDMLSLMIPVAGDCNKYVVCYSGRSQAMGCPSVLLFNYQLQTCDWPRNVVCSQ